jgi:hypothetical protein
MMDAELTEDQEDAIIIAYLEQVGEASLEQIHHHLEQERVRYGLEYLVDACLVEARGTEPNREYRMPAISVKLTSPDYHRGWTNADIAEAMRLYVRRHERIPAGLDWSKNYGRRSELWPGHLARAKRDHDDGIRWPSYALVLHHFGSWNAALEAAGLPVHDPGRRPRWAHGHALRLVS